MSSPASAEVNEAERAATPSRTSVVAALVELAGRLDEPPGIVDERGHEQLALAARGERAGQPDERVEAALAELRDHDRALRARQRSRGAAAGPTGAASAGSCCRIARSSSCSRGPGSSPSSSASERRASRSTSSASTGRPDR